jgi:Zn-dependent protease/predicted transcriptional regulator
LWGIDIQVHWSFVLILVYGAFVFGGGFASPVLGALYGILVIILLFACVLLHELGHALTAKYFKVNVPYITLLPIGGVAQLERMPKRPMHEFLIAIAGPAVNFALVILLLPVVILAVGLSMRAGVMTNVNEIFAMIQRPGFTGLMVNLAAMNLVLALFNLLPAFPMDGGRVLRALLAMVTGYVRATRYAVFVGRFMAILFAVIGVAQFNVILLLIAFFVYVGGRGELEAVESRYVLRDLTARQALNREVYALYTSEPVNRAVDLIMTSYQADFPVYDLSNNFVGVFSRAQLVTMLKEGQGEKRVVDGMIPAAQLPVVSPETSLADVWEKMMEARSRVVLVKESGRFLGLITLDDISEVIQVMGAAKAQAERSGTPVNLPNLAQPGPIPQTRTAQDLSHAPSPEGEAIPSQPPQQEGERS